MDIEGAKPSESSAPLEFTKVKELENICIDAARSERWKSVQESDDPDLRFSICLSGGGMRAAAFQAGVLWRLAQQSRLKDVEYLAAVSGGAYVASAFASFCKHKHDSQSRPEDLEAWYLKVVEEMILRMQSNAGNFVRDCVRSPCFETEGAGMLPRWCDVPALIFWILFTILVNPFTYLVAVLVPVAAAFHLFFGAGLRAGFCWKPPGGSAGATFVSYLIEVLHDWSSLYNFQWTLLVAFASYLSVSVITWQIPRNCDMYKYCHALRAFLSRFAAMLLLIIVLLGALLCSAFLRFRDFTHCRRELCAQYIQMQRNLVAQIGCSSCANWRRGNYWYDDERFSAYRNETFAFSVHCVAGEPPFLEGVMTSMGLIFVVITLVAASCALLCSWMGRELSCIKSFAIVPKCFGPVVLFLLSMRLLDFGIFGPILYSSRKGREWRNFVQTALLLGSIVLPFYEDLKTRFHAYYRRCLKNNFFADGKDVYIHDLENCHYCPFLLLTVVASDFEVIKNRTMELSFSPLHCGASKIHYGKVDKHLSLARCAALSGAGALDAMTLTMHHSMACRFWLTVMNLSWGDYIVFETHPTPRIDWFVNLISGCWPFRCCCNSWLVRRVLYRSYSIVPWCFISILLNLASYYDFQGGGENCNLARKLWSVAGVMIVLLLLVACFPFEECNALNLLGMSLLPRQLLQATMYQYDNVKAPRMLYVTDGGVVDCTALAQLMQRRCKRILLVLAASDPNDDFGVFNTTRKYAEEQKLGEFFVVGKYDEKQNDEQRKKAVDELLTEYKNDPEKFSGPENRSLHIGIHYPQDGETKGEDADLYIVKNGLPASLERDKVHPLLAPKDFQRPADFHADGLGDEGLRYTDLGCVGCCDCTHDTICDSCAPKFPHGGCSGYMYLTPKVCNGLVRLGFERSNDLFKNNSYWRRDAPA